VSQPILFTTPATGTGTVPLTTGTSLFALGILAGGTVNVSDGTFTTTYTSTGTDTVANLINGLNASAAGRANIAAWLNSSGKLVISSKNDTASLTVAGTYASAVGFGSGNNTFAPISPASNTSAASSSSTPAASPSSSASTSSSATTSTSGTTAATPRFSANSAFALQTVGTAELLLAGSGVAGSILNMLA
jgi:hypothetical protein